MHGSAGGEYEYMDEYTHTSGIWTPKLRALPSTGHLLGEFQWKNNYFLSLFVEIVTYPISMAFPHHVCDSELRTSKLPAVPGPRSPG